MGITSPYPRENIIAGNYILADTQAFLSKCHRQQNKEILIRHSPGIGECFLFSNIELTEKIKKISSGGCKNASQRFVLMKGYLGGKNKKLSSRACIYDAVIVLHTAFGWQAVVVPAHRVEHVVAVHALESRDHIGKIGRAHV